MAGLPPSITAGVDGLPQGDAELTPTPGEVLETGACAWCDRGPFERPRQHASQAHPEAWADFKNTETDQ